MSPGFYKFLADALVVFHISFVGFVLLGGAIVLRWRRVMWMHLPAVAWGIYIELSHHICPLTPLENRLRAWGGGATYQGSFVDHYIMPVLYPAGLTHHMQASIACVIVVLNAAAYGWIVPREVRRWIAARRVCRGASGAVPVSLNGTETVELPGDATATHQETGDDLAACTTGAACRGEGSNGPVSPERAEPASSAGKTPSVQLR